MTINLAVLAFVCCMISPLSTAMVIEVTLTKDTVCAQVANDKSKYYECNFCDYFNEIAPKKLNKKQSEKIGELSTYEYLTVMSAIAMAQKDRENLYKGWEQENEKIVRNPVYWWHLNEPDYYHHVSTWKEGNNGTLRRYLKNPF